jgi:hypothetical protein
VLQPELMRHARWWLVHEAYGGDLVGSAAYATRIIAYTILYGVIGMGNVRGASLSARVIALCVSCLYGAALVSTHRPTFNIVSAFYYAAIGVTAACNAAFLFSRVAQIGLKMRGPVGGRLPAASTTTVGMSTHDESPCALAVSSPPPSPPPPPSPQPPSPRMVVVPSPSPAPDVVPVSLATKLPASSVEIIASGAGAESSLATRVDARLRLVATRAWWQLRVLGALIVTPAASTQSAAHPHADGSPRIPYVLGVLSFTRICLLALVAWLVVAKLFPWMEEIHLEMEAALGPMAGALAADSIGLRIVSPRLYSGLVDLLVLGRAITPWISACVKGCSIVGLVVSALLSLYGFLSMWGYYTYTYRLASSGVTDDATREKYEGVQRSQSVLLISNHVAMTITGIALVVLTCNILGLLALILCVDWPGANKLRIGATRSVVLMCADALLIRPLLLPFFRLQQCSPAIFVILVWYLPLYLYAGAIRFLLTFAFVLVSFFEPGKAVLPGLARIDTGHSSFLAFCLEQVESDARERLRHWSAHPPSTCCNDAPGVHAAAAKSVRRGRE